MGEDQTWVGRNESKFTENQTAMGTIQQNLLNFYLGSVKNQGCQNGFNVDGLNTESWIETYLKSVPSHQNETHGINHPTIQCWNIGNLEWWFVDQPENDILDELAKLWKTKFFEKSLRRPNGVPNSTKYCCDTFQTKRSTKFQIRQIVFATKYPTKRNSLLIKPNVLTTCELLCVRKNKYSNWNFNCIDVVWSLIQYWQNCVVIWKCFVI